MAEIVANFFVFVIGASFGSFVTAASWRLPRDIDLVCKPSSCPSCSARLTAKDLIPILSYVLNGAKCRHCGVSVSRRYLYTEIVTAVMFLYLFNRFGLGAEFLIFAGVFVALAILVISDLETFIIPDSTTVAVFVFGLIYHYLLGSEWQVVLFGFAVGLGLALAVKYGMWAVMKQDPLGWGDVKFFAVAGMWLGLTFFGLMLFLAGVFGLVFGLLWQKVKKQKEFPFGPSIALAFYILVISRQDILIYLAGN